MIADAVVFLLLPPTGQSESGVRIVKWQTVNRCAHQPAQINHSRRRYAHCRVGGKSMLLRRLYQQCSSLAGCDSRRMNQRQRCASTRRVLEV